MGKRGCGGDRRSGQSYGENSIRYFPLCLWCGLDFPAKRPDARTCRPAHRAALARYVKRHGRPPLFPFGLQPYPKTPKHRT